MRVNRQGEGLWRQRLVALLILPAGGQGHGDDDGAITPPEVKTCAQVDDHGSVLRQVGECPGQVKLTT